MRKEFVLLFLFVFISGFVLADNNCVPNLKTNEFYGKVYVNSNPLIGGNYTLKALIDETIVGAQRIGSDGSYSIDVSPCPSVTSGKIYFIIEDVMAEESGKYEYDDSGAILTFLNLTFKKYPGSACGNKGLILGEECDDGNSVDGDGCSSICEVELGYKCTWSMSQGSICALEEYCGDGTCNNGETCSTCSNDCGTCPSSGENENNAGGGGGGGGGGSSSGSTSISVSGNNEPDSDEIISTKDLNKNKETTSQTGGMFNFLTGFVTGVGGFVNSTLGILVIVFVVLMIGLFVALRFFRIKKPKKK